MKPSYFQNLKNALNGQKFVIGVFISVIFTYILPMCGVHVNFDGEDTWTWLINAVDITGMLCGYVVTAIGLIHKIQKKEIDFKGVMNALFGKPISNQGGQGSSDNASKVAGLLLIIAMAGLLSPSFSSDRFYLFDYLLKPIPTQYKPLAMYDSVRITQESTPFVVGDSVTGFFCIKIDVAVEMMSFWRDYAQKSMDAGLVGFVGTGLAYEREIQYKGRNITQLKVSALVGTIPNLADGRADPGVAMTAGVYWVSVMGVYNMGDGPKLNNRSKWSVGAALNQSLKVN
jgi:hypothetical protein